MRCGSGIIRAPRSAEDETVNATLPLRLQCSAAVRMNRFFGHLVIEPHSARFEPSGLGNKLNLEPAVTVTQSTSPIIVVHGRWLAPWMNTGVVLTDAATLGTGTAVLGFRGGIRRTIVSALREAGFEVEDHATATSAGGNLGSVAELERFRSQRRAP